MKVLTYTSPARGHLYPVVPILTTLTERGHEVYAVTLAAELARLRTLGIECSPISPAVESDQLEDWRERSLRRALLSSLNTFARRASGEAGDLEAALRHHHPDVLLVDVNCWGAATVAEASGLPWAIYSPYLLPLPSRDAPAYGLGLKPLAGPLGAGRDRLINRLARRSLDKATLPTLAALRARHGLPALEHFTDLFAHPALLLALTAEGFEYPRRDWPANLRLVGPINWAPPQQTPGWLADLADPLVLVTCSTERQDDARLLEVALQALPAAGISVLGTSAAHDPDSFEAPPGSKVVSFVPHDAILERVVCVICHGGMGITQKALAAGIPVVVVPFGRDQLETASRVEAAAAGVRLAPGRLTPERLRSAVAEALDCSPGARRVADAYKAAGGSAAAATALEQLSPDA